MPPSTDKSTAHKNTMNTIHKNTVPAKTTHDSINKLANILLTAFTAKTSLTPHSTTTCLSSSSSSALCSSSTNLSRLNDCDLPDFKVGEDGSPTRVLVSSSSSASVSSDRSPSILDEESNPSSTESRPYAALSGLPDRIFLLLAYRTLS